MAPNGSYEVASPADWSTVRERLRAGGLRWTPQRRTLIDVLSKTDGHVTGAELIERCREIDPATIPSTVYRTLDVLEDLGLLSHSHRADGREEFHVQPLEAHGHLHCTSCGTTWEIMADEAAAVVDSMRRSRGFDVELSHLSISGQCAACAAVKVSRRSARPRR
jgi:Fur family transcriptional regulator, ferric uptake regulator